MKFHELSKIQDISIFEREFINLTQNNILSEYNKSIPDTLYHYTSLYGLEGILKNKEFWVSNCHFLNDQTEKYYTYEFCKDIVYEMSGGDWQIYNRVLKILDQHIFDMEESIYTLSLTSNKDSNLLWSNYSKNDGYNISLEYPRFVDEFRNYEANHHMAIYCSKVIYEKSEQKKILMQLIGFLYQLIDYYQIQEETKTLPEEMKSFIYAIAANVTVWATLFKDKAFAQEEEIRVVFLNDLDFIQDNFRISNGAFIPYIKMPFRVTERIIKGVTIGPKNKMDIAKKGMEMFLKANGYNYIEENAVIRSCIPYRY
ncbi:DUF2971 domain-containing protein [Bacillus inaquosorum]|uniref:DUF2971 domain-containing protein n=1 Tax=Bacillus inaquosorum TaxID=483913 RepID=UPI002281BE13|nr:DUF2971 domain-containing protein [Bacillus inaquosorum]MCY9296733.1 DUF2971 domain-containing protein [Bacillus inaquosorum]